jgi:hypothetical protein
MDPVPDPLLRIKSSSAGNRIQGLWVSSQELWPLDHRGGQHVIYTTDIVTYWGVASLIKRGLESVRIYSLWRDHNHRRLQSLVHLVHSFWCLLRCRLLELLLICWTLLVCSLVWSHLFSSDILALADSFKPTQEKAHVTRIRLFSLYPRKLVS